MSVRSHGYKGRVADVLEKAGIEIGNRVRISKEGKVYEGYLMPRSELGDDQHIVIKLDDGYNIGVRLSHDLKVEKLELEVEVKPEPPPLPLKVREDLPTVSIISTGGTIASRVDYKTGAVSPALSARDLYNVVPELGDIANINAEILYSLLSENMTAHHWIHIAETVAKHINRGVSGVVVTHGTDTMGYTAAALSFALQNLPVPVILVGSQRSSDRPSSDAATNLINAVIAASKAPIAEVMVAMHASSSDSTSYLHRGTKVRKCHTSRRDAFKTINGHPLAKVENGEVKVLTSNYVRREARKLELKAFFDDKVLLIKSYPGLPPALIDFAVDQGYHGIILEGTGLGHVPESCFKSIKRAVDNGIAVAMTSQCLWGRINMNVYSTGRQLLALGVIPLEDMLPETALVKMMWVLAQTRDLERVRELMLTNVAGEISPRSSYMTYPEQVF
ncbi:MAG: Glu-tRNA(Gln) amidotransferase GatDE subunit D [Candidatus Methanomethylicota archaeon]|uniref:Glutamyl-tRNA(Gln) amidotransferase subunit D n=1 Tax=Thermoproteota archaeon TaxID=2056631 RepID=A0A497EMZ3_9CREN|nr:MAG: Glu-tRNA(Gln) amidotransferase GatDE subunit D [Candidatus Verstraetearchaeota archaeon]RLE52874.1 MAG: Glu-tRNA(Gln) amidotransferase GatDE subunit D [Candidatus Verstraetearchaeota archaeon]